MNISFKKAEIKDAKTLAEIYNQSFYADYVKFGQCPGYGHTTESMKAAIETSTKYIILFEQKPVGALSFKETESNEYHIGCLCIIPEYQGKGIGTIAFHHILSLCKNWTRLSLDTPLEKEENVRFYTIKCGMQLGETQTDGNVKIVELYMER